MACEEWLFTWRDDRTWSEVLAATPGQRSDGIWPETSLRHYRGDLERAWLYFGYWRDHDRRLNIEIDHVPGHRHMAQVGLVGDWPLEDGIPPEVVEVVGSWVDETFAHRLWSHYVLQREVNHRGNLAAWLTVDDADLDVGDYWAELWANDAYPPMHPFYHAPGRFHLATPTGNWSVGIPMREWWGYDWYFYADAWWNAGFEVRTNATAPDAWATLYDFSNETGIRIPSEMVAEGPRPCGAHQRSRIGGPEASEVAADFEDEMDPSALPECIRNVFQWEDPGLRARLEQQGVPVHMKTPEQGLPHRVDGPRGEIDIWIGAVVTPRDYAFADLEAVGLRSQDPGSYQAILRGERPQGSEPGPSDERIFKDLGMTQQEVAALWDLHQADRHGQSNWNHASVGVGVKDLEPLWRRDMTTEWPMEPLHGEQETESFGRFVLSGADYQWTFGLAVHTASVPGGEIQMDDLGRVRVEVESGSASPNGTATARQALEALTRSIGIEFESAPTYALTPRGCSSGTGQGAVA